MKAKSHPHLLLFQGGSPTCQAAINGSFYRQLTSSWTYPRMCGKRSMTLLPIEANASAQRKNSSWNSKTPRVYCQRVRLTWWPYPQAMPKWSKIWTHPNCRYFWQGCHHLLVLVLAVVVTMRLFPPCMIKRRKLNLTRTKFWAKIMQSSDAIAQEGRRRFDVRLSISYQWRENCIETMYITL